MAPRQAKSCAKLAKAMKASKAMKAMKEMKAMKASRLRVKKSLKSVKKVRASAKAADDKNVKIVMNVLKKFVGPLIMDYYRIKAYNSRFKVKYPTSLASYATDLLKDSIG